MNGEDTQSTGPVDVDVLAPVIYEQLRAIADSYFRGQPSDHTLQPTALVHEAFLRLAGARPGAFTSRAHFAAVAARAMRQILVNHAEKRGALKRGGERRRVPLDEHAGSVVDVNHDLVSLDEAMRELAEADPRKASVVEMRFFGGLTTEEIGVVLGVSRKTVESDWRMARAWLSRRIASHE